MTKEEAITNLEKLVALFYTESEQSKMVDYSKIIETLEFAAAALRPITREQIEKMRGKFFQAGIDDVAQDTWRCSRCLVQEFGNIQGINFCPHCGAPMTDKAVDMVIKRLEALGYGKDD